MPVSAQPNAGQPRRTGPRSFEFSIDGGYFARYLRRFADAGVTLVGGCCGTTPTHIKAAVEAVRPLLGSARRAAGSPASGSAAAGGGARRERSSAAARRWRGRWPSSSPRAVS